MLWMTYVGWRSSIPAESYYPAGGTYRKSWLVFGEVLRRIPRNMFVVR